VIAYAAIAILAVIGAYAVISRTVGPPESATAAETPKLAVLPFDNLGSSEDDYFADGITEEITSRIAQISGLHVISRTSAMQYKNHNKTLQQIGEELRVDYLLEGTIRTDRAPDGSGQVRVTPQLIRVSDDAHLWTNRYTANLVPGEIFGVQEQIANQVAEALDVTLLEPERRRLAVKPTDNLEAYDYYLRGNDYMRAGWEPELLRIAVDLHSRAVALDPAFALAYTALADAHLKMYQLYFDRTEERLGEAKNAVDKALELGPELPETHVALGLYHYRGKGEYDWAVEQFTIALEGKPNNALALNAIGSVYRRQGKWSEAATYFERALALDPRSPEMAMDLGVTYHALRQYGEAERYYDRAIALGPDQSAAYLLKAVLRISADGSTARAGRVLREASDRLGSAFLTIPLSFADFTWALQFLDERGQHELAELASTTPGIDPAIYYGVRAQLHHRWQEPASARAYYDSARVLLESRVTESPDDAYFHSLLGIAYAGLDRRDDAIREGRRGVELLPISRDALQGASILGLLSQIYVMVGEHDVAIDEIENILSVPALLSVHWLRADPFFDPLRDNPRFQALLAKYEN
jgi:serine/threonine-protein kinase